MRERPLCLKYLFASTRITPAYAGKTYYYYALLHDMWDHPRVCGKDRKAKVHILCVPGSPPRMRERRRRMRRIVVCAVDHPRVCGKDCFWFCHSFLLLGSPPRMRERRVIYIKGVLVFGITPAYAGKTFGSECPAMSMRDHPRVCGKDIKLLWL